MSSVKEAKTAIFDMLQAEDNIDKNIDDLFEVISHCVYWRASLLRELNPKGFEENDNGR